MHRHAFYLNFLIRLRHEKVYFVLLFAFARKEFKILFRKTNRMKTIYVVENLQSFVILWFK